MKRPTRASALREGPGRSPLVEACVTTAEEAVQAVLAGANRLELCVDLRVGGLTPPEALVEIVKASVTVPVFAMLRDRPGPYRWPRSERPALLRGLQSLLRAGADGLVFGTLTDDYLVDVETLSSVRDAAGPKPVTFHRAFDETQDQRAALEALMEVGIPRVLSGGGPGRAWNGRKAIRELVEQGGSVITILAGGGVRGSHVQALVDETGVVEVHARGLAIPEITLALRSA